MMNTMVEFTVGLLHGFFVKATPEAYVSVAGKIAASFLLRHRQLKTFSVLSKLD